MSSSGTVHACMNACSARGVLQAAAPHSCNRRKFSKSGPAAHSACIGAARRWGALRAMQSHPSCREKPWFFALRSEGKSACTGAGAGAGDMQGRTHPHHRAISHHFAPRCSTGRPPCATTSPETTADARESHCKCRVWRCAAAPCPDWGHVPRRPQAIQATGQQVQRKPQRPLQDPPLQTTVPGGSGLHPVKPRP